MSRQHGKAATESLTIISAFVTLVGGVLALFDVDLDVPGVAASIDGLLIIAGAVGAMYGRKRAQGPITSIIKARD